MSGLGALAKAAKAAKAAKTIEKAAPVAEKAKEFVFPKDQALETARKNAGLAGQSVSKQERMLQQGFEPGWFHGTTGDISKFRTDLLGESTGAQSAKKAFFFARDPQNPPEKFLKKTTDQESVNLLKKLGISDEEIAKLNEVSLAGHGAETASGYARLGGSRQYKEAMRKANAAEKDKDWSEYEKWIQIAEDAEIGKSQDLQDLVAKYGEKRDLMLDSINNAILNKTLPQAQQVALDEKIKQLMPYGWYNSYSIPQLKALKGEIANLAGKSKETDQALKNIDDFISTKAERQLAESYEEGSNVLPVALRYKNPFVYDFGGSTYRDQTYSDLVDQARRGGHDALIMKNTFDPGAGPAKLVDIAAVFDPKQIRSRFAAFDPEKINDPDLLATLAAFGIGLPELYDMVKQDKAPESYASGGAVHMSDGGDPERAAFGIYPSSGKRREELNVSRNVNAPLQLARGWLAGTLGIPGDVETLGRLLANFSFGPGGVKVPTESVLPTSEYFQEVIPGRDTSPAGELFSGAGQLTGGLGAIKATKAAGRAAKAAGEALAPKAGQMAEGYLQKAGLMPGVIKPKGGNWLKGDIERQTEPLKQGMGVTPMDEAELQNFARQGYTQLNPSGTYSKATPINEWIDKKLNKYIRNEMGTPEDPVRALAERGILHFEPQQLFGDAPSTLMRKRAGAGMPTPLFGQSEMARRWESLADRAIDPFPAGSYKYGALDESFLASNPWLEKVPDEAMVYKAKGLRRDMGFDHLIDELHNATRPDSDLPARLRWKPEDLQKVTMEQAVRRVHEINEYRAAKKAEADAARAQNPATFLHKEYETVPGTSEPNQKGLKWVELKAPSNETMPLEERKALIQKLRAEGGDPETWPREQLEAALKYEGETMGHCVGGYCPDVESGRSRIFSLRDKKGEPHVTVEVAPRKEYPTKNDIPDDILDKLTEEGRAAGNKRADELGYGLYSEMRDLEERIAISNAKDNWMWNNPIIKNEIVQIKGKGNKAPKNEYLPFVQDFVKGGQWSRVGDYRNTGLRERAEMFDALDLNKLKAAGHDVPEHLTPDESKKYSDLLYTIDTGKNPETGLPTQNYAEGGAVGIETTPDMSDGGKIIPTKEVNAKKGGAVEKMTETLTRGGMDKDKATLHAIKLAQAREQEPIKVKKKVVPEGAEEFRRAVEQKFQAGGLAKFLTQGAKAAVAEKKVATFTDKVLANQATKMAEKIAADNPKLTEEQVAKKALTQADKKLTWEREQKPELEKTYGTLEKSKYTDPLQKRQRNVAPVVEERVKKAQEFLAQPTEPWQPPPGELQAFDRERIKDALEGFPGVEQTKFPRYEPARADLSHVEETYSDPVNRELIKSQIARGLPLGGETFYASLYPMKLAALERGIPEEKFNQFIYSIAPASARNSILNEVAVGQFLRDMRARGLPLDEETVKKEMAAFKQKYGTGLPLMPIHREGVRQVLEGPIDLREHVKADIPTNYKIPTYGTQKAGDFGKSVVLDVHEAAGETQGSRYHPYFTEQGGFGPTEYGLAENKMLDIAKEMGIPGGMAQAGRWFGGGELTGLKSPRGDALDLLEKQAAYTLQGQGINPTPRVIREYLLNMIDTGEGLMMPYFKSTPLPDVRTVKKEGGLAQATRK